MEKTAKEIKALAIDYAQRQLTKVGLTAFQPDGTPTMPCNLLITGFSDGYEIGRVINTVQTKTTLNEKA